MTELRMSSASSRAAASAGASTRRLVIGTLVVVAGDADGSEVEVGDAAESLEMALVAGMGAGIDGGLARQEFLSEIFESAGPFVAHGIGIRISDENRSCALIGQELRTRVTHAPFESGFACANAGKEDAAQVFDVTVGSVKGELRIGGAFALPCGGRDAAGFVIQKQAAAIGEEVDAIRAKIEAQIANVDIGKSLFAGFHGEGLTFGFNVQPFFDAHQEAALFRCEAGLLPRVERSGAESGRKSGIDVDGENAGKCFCGDGSFKIAVAVDGLRCGRGKEALHDIVEQTALCGGAEPPFCPRAA